MFIPKGIADLKVEVKVKDKPIKVAKAKKIAVRTNSNTVTHVENKSDFKSARHLVEYLLVTERNIRYDQAERLVRKAFPEVTFDAGMFTWWKLDYVKNGNLMFREDIDRMLPKPKEEVKAEPEVGSAQSIQKEN